MKGKKKRTKKKANGLKLLCLMHGSVSSLRSKCQVYLCEEGVCQNPVSHQICCDVPSSLSCVWGSPRKTTHLGNVVQQQCSLCRTIGCSYGELALLIRSQAQDYTGWDEEDKSPDRTSNSIGYQYVLRIRSLANQLKGLVHHRVALSIPSTS